MAIRWKILDRLSTAITVSQFFGVPAVSGLFAAIGAFWTSHHSGGALITALVAMIVFVSALWSGIGLIWLWDKGRSSANQNALDTAWGLVSEAVFLNIDPYKDRYAQISFNLKNVLTRPIRVEVREVFLEIENRIPDQKMEKEIKVFILIPNAIMQINCPTYSKSSFPSKLFLVANLRFSFNYGHPDGAYTRTMSRNLRLEIHMPPPNNLPMFASLPNQPAVGRFIVNSSPEQEDEDIPFRVK